MPVRVTVEIADEKWANPAFLKAWKKTFGEGTGRIAKVEEGEETRCCPFYARRTTKGMMAYVLPAIGAVMAVGGLYIVWGLVILTAGRVMASFSSAVLIASVVVP